jgi:hypothetical protein
MSASKRNIIFLIVLLAIVGGAAFFTYTKIKKPDLHPFQVIPNDAFMVVKADNLFEALDLYSQSDLWDENVEDLAVLKEQLDKINSFIDQPFDLRDKSSEFELYFSVHLTESNTPDVVLYMPSTAGLTKRSFEDIIENNYSEECLLDESDDFLCTLLINNFDKVLYYTDIHGVLCFSFNDALLINARNHVEAQEPRIDSHPDFTYLQAVSGKKTEANIYVNYLQLPALLEGLLSEDYTEEVRDLSSFASWSELDLTANRNAILLNGYTVMNDSLFHFLSSLKSEQSYTFQAESIIPADVNSFISMRFDSFEKYHKGFTEYKSMQNDANEFFQLGTQLNQKYGIKAGTLDEWIANEIDFVRLNNSSSKKGDGLMFTLQVDDLEKAKSCLKKCADGTGTGGVNISYKGHSIHRLGNGDFLSYLVGSMADGIKKPYYSFVDSYLIIAQDRESIQYCIRKKNEGNVLSGNASYNYLKSNMAKEANFSLYILNPSSLSTFGDNEAREFVRKNKWLNKTSGLGIQFISSGEIFFTNAFVEYSTDVNNEVRIISTPKPDPVANSDESTSEVQIQDVAPVVIDNSSKQKIFAKTDALIKGSPQIVSSHKSSKNHIIVFDIENNMYYFDETGNRIWKAKIKEAPMSKVYEVDAYKNRKVQYLFNTESYLYLVDINGNLVNGYPKKLPNKAASPITLFDYNRRKDYRIIYGGVNKKLYNLTVKGNQVSGWKKTSLKTAFTGYAQRLIFNRKDHLLFPLSNGNIYVCDRRGNMRISLKEKVKNSLLTDCFLNKTNSKGDIISTDTKGNLFYLNSTGKVSRTHFTDFSKNHFFIYDDFDHDGSHDFIYVDGKKLRIYDRFKKLQYQYDFSNSISVRPILIESGSRHILAVTDKQLGQVYLFDHNGLIEKYSGFAGDKEICYGNLESRRVVVLSTFGTNIYRNELP